MTLPAASTTTAPSTMTRPMADLIGRCMNRMEDHPGAPGKKLVSASFAPRDDERAALEGRRTELLSGLRPASLRELLPPLIEIIANGDGFGMSREEAVEKAKLYAKAADGLPLWAVQRAQIALSRPKWKSAWNGRGIPSSADVVAESQTFTQPVEAELYRLGQILDAEVVDNSASQEKRDEQIAAWEALKATIGRSNAMPGRTDEEVARERSEQQRANSLTRDREERARRRIQDEIDAALKSGGEPFTGIERTKEAQDGNGSIA